MNECPTLPPRKYIYGVMMARSAELTNRTQDEGNKKEVPMSSLNHAEFRELLDLLMIADPKPTPVPLLRELADKESKVRGFDNWIDAYHEFDPSAPRFQL